MIYNYLKNFDKIMNKYKLPKVDRSIIIGSSPSIYNYDLSSYINNYDGLVVRINRSPLKKNYKFYGSRTDLLINNDLAKLWYLNNKESEEYFNNYKFLSIYFDHDDIVNLLDNNTNLFYPDSNNKLWITTGLITILIMMNLSDEIELFGFGDGSEENITNLYRSSYTDDIIITSHYISIEHKFINELLLLFSSIKRIEGEYGNRFIIN